MRWLITGGVGFIGTNVAEHLIEAGHDVALVDDLSRAGVHENARYLRERFSLEPLVLDIADSSHLWSFLDEQEPFDAIAHLAGQVSLLESLRNPVRDFQVNAGGTLNLLEHVRMHSPETAVVGMSSNKVYGDLSAVEVTEEETRYVAPAWPLGFDESLPVEFHGPYGCSKGVADQYLADFARSFGLRTASLRQSSVYGPHQHPRSDQGWVAHLIGEAVSQRPIQLNGVGKQVRDLLHAKDLARLIETLGEKIQPYEVNQFNVGGGLNNAMSILELFEWLEERTGRSVDFATGDERPSDQKVFVADLTRVTAMSGWRPSIGLDQGLDEVARGYEAGSVE